MAPPCSPRVGFAAVTAVVAVTARANPLSFILYPLFVILCSTRRGYIADRPEQLLPTWASAHSAKDIRHGCKGPRPPEVAPAMVSEALATHHCPGTRDQGWTEPQGTPDGNVTWYVHAACLGLTRLRHDRLFQEAL